MRKLLIILIILLPAAICGAQLKAPVQRDTLVITSMRYHYEPIRQENWPFDCVIRTAESFIFGNREFKIRKSERMYYGIVFTLVSGNETVELVQTGDNETITVQFSDYILECVRKSAGATGSAGRPKITSDVPGRTAVTVPSPSIKVLEPCTVVIDIWVTQYGVVERACIGEGTDCEDSDILSDVCRTALLARFSAKSDAPALQEGTITFIFN